MNKLKENTSQNPNIGKQLIIKSCIPIKSSLNIKNIPINVVEEFIKDFGLGALEKGKVR